ncbi:uncharacterized protein [Bemisia tabaci]|uniref:uncharacterized protein n=1 Tax=Bemisia tabaci TaxID=7038 RepID=UPI003B27F317
MQAEVETRPPLEKDLALGLSEGHLERINSALSDSSVTGGKVRQFFQERRCPRSKSHGATARGWDKSFPLEPLKKGVKAKTIPLHTPILNLDEINSNLRLKDKFSFNKSPGLNGDTQGLSNINTVIFTKLPNIGGPLISEKKPDNRIGEEFNAQSGITTNKGEMSPTKDVSAITRGISRLPVSPKRKIEPPKPIGGLTKVASTEEKKPQAPPQAPGRRVPRPNITTTTLSPPKTVTTAKPTIPVIKSLKPPAVKPAPLKPKAPAGRAGAGVGAKAAPKDEAATDFDPKSRPVPPGLEQCPICFRSFAPDRIAAHKKVCQKTTKKKRKAFDPVKQRLEGTEAAQFLTKKGGKAPKKSNWRAKHEEFINNIRAAKLAQEHVAKGGKLSDLPPPPPMDTSHLTPCPHCGRKFNEQAAERHIPRCAEISKRTPKKPTPVKRR